MIPGALLALDVGDVRTGVAVSDALQIMASPYQTVPMKGHIETDAAALARIIEEVGPVTIVVGMPLNQHGEPGPQAGKVTAMVEALRKRVTPPIELVDERFSTAEAHRHLRAAQVKGKKQKANVDQVAAALILETYMQREKNRGAR